MADLEGGSITVSNAGMHNVTYMTSIINPGQSMILGVGSIRSVFRPDAAGQPVVRQELGLVLSVDHRVSDGVGALRYLNLIVDLLQHPARLLLD
jgi:pyruvate dehydrogenase E2 component (dihydrolipoamide acetyltransferase)